MFSYNDYDLWLHSFEIKVCDRIVVDLEMEAFGGSEDVVSGFRPPEGFRVLVVRFDEGADVRFGLPCGGMGAPLQLLARRFGEPALDPVDPGGRGRRGMDGANEATSPAMP